MTDAQLVLGRIDEEAAIGETGAIHLRKGLAEEAILREVGGPLGLDAIAAADSIITVVNDKIAGYLRRITVARGLDPREMSLVAFGGAGPLHAAALLRAADMAAVIVPPLPGVLSAQGCVSADFRHDYVQAVTEPLDDVVEERLAEIRDEHRSLGDQMLDLEGVAAADRELEVRADMAYLGQTHSVLVRLEPEQLRRRAIAERFEKVYEGRYGRLLSGPIELTNLRTTVIGKRSVETRPTAEAGAVSSSGTRRIHFDGSWHEAPVRSRHDLAPGEPIEGPAVIEQSDTTILVEPGISAMPMPTGALVMKEDG